MKILFIIISAVFFFFPSSLNAADKETMCLLSKNPMCIVSPSQDRWEGQIGKKKGGFAVFKEHKYGIIAGINVLYNYSVKHKVNTLEKLTKRYCRGDYKRYARILANHTGIKSSTKKINLLDHLPKIVEGIIIVENGKCPYSMETIQQCIDIFKEKKKIN